MAEETPRTSAHIIPQPEATERLRAQAVASYEANHDEVDRVLLLYSGGLDTSVMLKWIQDSYEAEVVALTVNLGQPGEDFDVVRGKALDLGALGCHVVDAREAFAHDYVLPAIKANAVYGSGYPLFTALGRPLIAKLAVKKAHEAGCDTIAHGCTGKGNDQVRIESTVMALDLGALDCLVEDAREEFAHEYVLPAIKANALYGGGYPLFTALGRPLIARLAVDHARRAGCDTIAHGCTGKGNDQVRIEGTVATLAPELGIIAPVREWQMGREEEIAYARRHGIPIKGGAEQTPYSIDDNLWGRSSEGRWIEELD
ncbi:MAG: argininosuccinate synthase, partial [Actinomycetota bacterium]|nr:argininosuccinate synthase [Actinomycetota bacterium]